MCSMSSSPHLCMCTLAQVLLLAPSKPDRRDLANGLMVSYTLKVLGKGKVIRDGNQSSSKYFPSQNSEEHTHG